MYNKKVLKDLGQLNQSMFPKITSQGLLDQSRAGLYISESTTYPPPRFRFFWAYSLPLPQGVEMLL